MKLYEINEELKNVIDWETGEIIDEEKLNELTMAKREKEENIAVFIKELKYRKAAIKEEKARLTAMDKSVDAKIDWLENYLMHSLDGEEIKDSARVSVSYRKNWSVNILDEKLIPDEYKETEVVTKISKTDIGNAIKSGVEVAGAERVQTTSMIIK